MIVARQFIAWYPCENGNRPEGHGMTGSEGRATIKTTNQCKRPGAFGEKEFRDFAFRARPVALSPGLIQKVERLRVDNSAGFRNITE
jgi:hypothetical protein